MQSNLKAQNSKIILLGEGKKYGDYNFASDVIF